MLMKARYFLIMAGLAVLVVVAVMWVASHVAGYDQRYDHCMQIKQAQLNPAGHYFPDDAYDEAMRDCERQAGVPTVRTEHPHPVDETP
jgi:hypothetical protein